MMWWTSHQDGGRLQPGCAQPRSRAVTARSAAAWQALLDRGVLVRDVGLPGWLRVTAGTTEETDAFLTALGEVAPAHRSSLGGSSA